MVYTDLEYIYEDRKGVVLSVTWDRDMAAQQSREALASSARNGTIQSLDNVEEQVGQDVVSALARYSLFLPKQKKGAPPWRCLRERVMERLMAYRIAWQADRNEWHQAYIVREDGHWADVHYDGSSQTNKKSYQKVYPPKNEKAKRWSALRSSIYYNMSNKFSNPYLGVKRTARLLGCKLHSTRRLPIYPPSSHQHRTLTIITNTLFKKLCDRLRSLGITDISRRQDFEFF